MTVAAVVAGVRGRVCVCVQSLLNNIISILRTYTCFFYTGRLVSAGNHPTSTQ